jgi:dsDNA-specific endonuclease/ATPase MutS2
VKEGAGELPAPEPAEPPKAAELQVGSRVEVAPFGLAGVVLELHEKHADIDMNGTRLRARIADLRVVGGPAAKATVRVNVDLQPRSGSLSELNVICCTVVVALTRAVRLLDENIFTDQRSVRVVLGYGYGQLRRAIAGFLNHNPLVAHF